MGKTWWFRSEHWRVRMDKKEKSPVENVSN